MGIYKQMFIKAVNSLKEALEYKSNDKILKEISQDSAIQRFEFCTDLMWKYLKEILSDKKGISSNSPKDVIRAAIQVKIITKDDFWLKIVDMRNLTSHTYNNDLAKEIYSELKKCLKYFKEVIEIE